MQTQVAMGHPMMYAPAAALDVNKASPRRRRNSVEELACDRWEKEQYVQMQTHYQQQTGYTQDFRSAPGYSENFYGQAGGMRQTSWEYEDWDRSPYREGFTMPSSPYIYQSPEPRMPQERTGKHCFYEPTEALKDFSDRRGERDFVRSPHAKDYANRTNRDRYDFWDSDEYYNERRSYSGHDRYASSSDRDTQDSHENAHHRDRYQDHRDTYDLRDTRPKDYYDTRQRHRYEYRDTDSYEGKEADRYDRRERDRYQRDRDKYRKADRYDYREKEKRDYRESDRYDGEEEYRKSDRYAYRENENSDRRRNERRERNADEDDRTAQRRVYREKESAYRPQNDTYDRRGDQNPRYSDRTAREGDRDRKKADRYAYRDDDIGEKRRSIQYEKDSDENYRRFDRRAGGENDASDRKVVDGYNTQRDEDRRRPERHDDRERDQYSRNRDRKDDRYAYREKDASDRRRTENDRYDRDRGEDRRKNDRQAYRGQERNDRRDPRKDEPVACQEKDPEDRRQVDHFKPKGDPDAEYREQTHPLNTKRTDVRDEDAETRDLVDGIQTDLGRDEDPDRPRDADDGITGLRSSDRYATELKDDSKDGPESRDHHKVSVDFNQDGYSSDTGHWNAQKHKLRAIRSYEDPPHSNTEEPKNGSNVPSDSGKLNPLKPSSARRALYTGSLDRNSFYRRTAPSSMRTSEFAINRKQKRGKRTHKHNP